MKKTTSNSEHYGWGTGCEGWHLLQRDDLSVIQERVPPGESETLHYHNKARQFFYILRGQAVIVIAGERVALRASDGIEIPPGTPHQFRNESEAMVELLVISMPKSHGDRVNT